VEGVAGIGTWQAVKRRWTFCGLGTVGRAPPPANCLHHSEMLQFLSVTDNHRRAVDLKAEQGTHCCRLTHSRARAPAPHLPHLPCGVQAYFWADRRRHRIGWRLDQATPGVMAVESQNPHPSRFRFIVTPHCGNAARIGYPQLICSRRTTDSSCLAALARRNDKGGGGPGSRVSESKSYAGGGGESHFSQRTREVGHPLLGLHVDSRFLLPRFARGSE
jgi:hypothetical protein